MFLSGSPPTQQLVLAFGSRDLLSGQAMDQVRSAHPNAQIVGCSTAGEICGSRVLDETLTVTAVSFANTRVETAETRLLDANDSRDAGRRVAGSAAGRGIGSRPGDFGRAQGQRQPTGQRNDRDAACRSRRHRGLVRGRCPFLKRRWFISTGRPAKAGSSRSDFTASSFGSATARSAGGILSAPSGWSLARWAMCFTSWTANRRSRYTKNTSAHTRPDCPRAGCAFR